jgi:hypothetical protein
MRSTAQPQAMALRLRLRPGISFTSSCRSVTRSLRQPVRARAAATASAGGVLVRGPAAPKPHRSINGPTVGSKAPSVSSHTFSEARTISAKAGETGKGSVVAWRLKRLISLSAT